MLLTYVELARWVFTVTMSIALAILVIFGIAGCCSGSSWLFRSGASPLSRRLRRTSLERTMRRETSDLDRRLAEFTGDPLS